MFSKTLRLVSDVFFVRTALAVLMGVQSRWAMEIGTVVSGYLKR